VTVSTLPIIAGKPFLPGVFGQWTATLWTRLPRAEICGDYFSAFSPALDGGIDCFANSWQFHSSSRNLALGLRYGPRKNVPALCVGARAGASSGSSCFGIVCKLRAPFRICKMSLALQPNKESAPAPARGMGHFCFLPGGSKELIGRNNIGIFRLGRFHFRATLCPWMGLPVYVQNSARGICANLALGCALL